MIEIVSFPGPDRSVTQEGLKRYKVSNRRYRNRRIGDILKELHLTEGRNPVASGGMVRLHSSFFRAEKLFMIIFCFVESVKQFVLIVNGTKFVT